MFFRMAEYCGTLQIIVLNVLSKDSGAIKKNGSTIQYAPDGLHFSVMARIPKPPMAPGGYRPDAFTDTRYGQGLCWGISMVHAEDPYLVRFECTLAASARAKASLDPNAPG